MNEGRTLSGFVTREGSEFYQNGQEFRIAGANAYYLGYVEPPVIESVLDLAQSMNLNVLRVWGFFESIAGSNVYFHNWNTARREADFRSGSDGLERLDLAIHLAGQRGLRLIISLTNYWPAFGGMPAYCGWFNLSGTHQFYRDGRCRAAYWQWVEQLLLRRNKFTCRTYADEPAIFAWELANEPRCESENGKPLADGEDVLLAWIWEMSTLLRSKDKNHLVGLGDEGFFHRKKAGNNALFNGLHGTSFERFLGVRTVDFGTFHMYGHMAHGGDLRTFGRMWVQEHVAAGAREGKPVILEEYGAELGKGGIVNADDRAALYRDWLREVSASGAAGSLVWMIGIPKSASQPYDPDPYVIYGGPEAGAIGDHAISYLGAAAL